LYVTIHRIERLTFEKVVFYTVRLNSNECEFDDFITRLGTEKKYRPQLALMFQLIKEMGADGAAKEAFFKCRGQFKNGNLHVSHIEIEKEETTLILYCLRLSDSLVILLNGGLKTNNDIQKCESKSHYETANKMASGLKAAILKTKNMDILEGIVALADNTQIEIV